MSHPLTPPKHAFDLTNHTNATQINKYRSYKSQTFHLTPPQDLLYSNAMGGVGVMEEQIKQACIHAIQVYDHNVHAGARTCMYSFTTACIHALTCMHTYIHTYTHTQNKGALDALKTKLK
jgi:hypothetical protein